MKLLFVRIPVLLILSGILPWIRYENLDAQEFTVKRLTTQAGLSHNNIRAIVRDSTGFLWLATWDGLSRFDGYNFKNYYHVPNDSTSIHYFAVRQVVVDRFNNLWVLTDLKLLEKYNRSSDNFSLLKEIDGIRLDDVSFIDTDSAGILTFINGSKIIKWNERIQKGTVLSLTSGPGKDYRPDQAFVSGMLFKGNELWITGTSVLLFGKGTVMNYIFKRDYSLANPYLKRIDFDYIDWSRLYISHEGKKWVFSNRGMYSFDEAKDLFILQKNNKPEGVFKGKDAILWGDLNDGLYIYETRGSVLKNIPLELTGFPIAFMADADNTVWFSGVSPSGVPQGLSHAIFTSGFFRNNIITAPDSTQPAVYAIAVDNRKNTWVGIRGFDDIKVIGTDGVRRSAGRLSPELLMRSGHIRSMSSNSDGIWIGHYFNLLRFYSFRERKFYDYFPGLKGYRAILPLGGKVYIGSENINAFDPANAKTDTIWRSNNNLSCFKMYADTGGIVWCAMAKGTIVKVNINTGKDSIIVIPPGQSNTEDVIKDRKGDLWLAFLGDGVCRFNPDKGTTKFYTTQNGLSNNTTYNLLDDSSGNIWVSTNNGISMINPVTDKVRTFGLSDGLKIHEFNSGAKFRTEDGEFLFGGMGGFVRFYPDSLSYYEKSTTNQKIILTEFKVSGFHRALAKSLNESDTIKLRPGENNFNIVFSSNDFKNSENIRYRYRLSGVNSSWIETDSYNRNLNYSNLRSGFHTLLIEANDVNGNWTAKRKLIIRIQPYFFQTLGFLIALPAFIVLLLILSVILYIRQVRYRERQKQEALRLQTLQGQMNPHFIFNSLNSINYFISNNDKLSANRYIADFAKLIRSILHNMNHSYITLEKEIESVEEYLKIEYLRFGDKFDYNISVDKDIHPDEIKVSPGMVQPFIENAIWHGVRGLENRKGNISVKFGFLEGKLVCEIVDDGIGRRRSNEMKSENDQKKSRGIEIVNERLRILNNLQNKNYKVIITDLYSDKTESGTRVLIELPLLQN